MVEVRTVSIEQPKQPQPASPKDIWEKFNAYQIQAKEGFVTNEQELATYGGVIEVLASYVQQDDVRNNPQGEDRKFIGDMFYGQVSNTEVPVDFFVETAKDMRQHMRGKQRTLPKDVFWKEQFAVLSARTQAELYRVKRLLETEKWQVVAIEKLAEKGKDHPLLEEVRTSVSPFEQRMATIQETALQLLSSNGELGQDIAERDAFIRDVEEMLSGTPAQQAILKNPAALRGKLIQHEAFLEKKDGSSMVDDLYVAAFQGRTFVVSDSLREVVNNFRSPNVLLRLWEEKGVMPKHLMDTFEDVALIAELAEVSQALAGKPKEVRAAALLPYVQQGVSTTLLHDIVQGNMAVPKEIMVQQVDAFLHFYDAFEKQTKKPGMSPLKKQLIAAAVGVVLVATPIAYYYVEQHYVAGVQEEKADKAVEAIMQALPQVQEPQQASQPLPKTSPLQFSRQSQPGAKENNVKPETANTSEKPKEKQAQAEQEKPKQQEPQKQEGAKSTAEATEQQQPQVPSQTESASWGERLSSRPDNNSLEGMEKAMERVAWRLEGKDVWGFYRTGTASRFEEEFRTREKKWFNSTFYPQNPTPVSVQASSSDVRMYQETLRIQGDKVEIPVRDTDMPAAGTFHVGGIDRLNMYMRDDGTYVMQFLKEDIGKQISVTIGMQTVDAERIPAPTDSEYKHMLAPLITRKDLPEETQSFLRALDRRPNLSLVDKARALEQYVASTFTYSLIPEYSDYYHQAKTIPEFIKRIFELKKVDCDVANTALIALLRSEGIAARMVFGFAHTGTFLSSKAEEITDAESHGWVEVYDKASGRWYSLDGTPSNMDEFTEKGLKDKLGEPRLQRRTRQDLQQGRSSRQGAPGPIKVEKGDKWQTDEKPGNGKNGDGTQKETDKSELSKEANQKLQKELQRLEQSKTGERFSWLTKKDVDGGLDFLRKALYMELLNASLLAANAFAEAKNKQLHNRLQKTLEARGKEYFGEAYHTAQSGQVMSDERIELNRQYPNRMPMALRALIPHEVVNVLRNIRQGTKLENIQYKDNEDTIPTAASPNAVEFLSGVLGYDEKKMREKVYHDEYQAADDAIYQARTNMIAQFTPPTKYYLSEKYQSAISNAIPYYLFDLVPGTAEWNNTIDESVRRARADCKTVRIKRIKELQAVRKRKYSFDSIKEIEDGDLRAAIDYGYRFAVVRTQMRQTYHEALQSIGKVDLGS